MALKLKETNHSYYCSESNFYVNGYQNFGRCEYESWNSFKEEWLNPEDLLDDDLNHVFRFDITKNEKNPEKYDLWLFFILQRKGIYRPVWIKNITSDDISDIEDFLKDRWEYMKNQWVEVLENVK